MHIDIDNQANFSPELIPSEAQLTTWVELALASTLDSAKLAQSEVSIQIVDEEEIQELNSSYRKKNKVTNVLSFPVEPYPGIELCGINLLGDIVIAPSVVAAEAQQQGKELWSHWAHLIIHASLHLLGYDHEIAAEAEVMEQLEVELLAKLHISNPYEVRT